MVPVAFRDVSFGIEGRQILAALNLSIEAGETVVLLGRSGSGKTTALKLINGMLFPSFGEVSVEGKPTTAWDPIRLKRRIGYVIQETGLFPHFTVAENIGLIPKLEGWKQSDIDGRVDELLETLGMPASEFRSRFPRQLSGGQKQRVGIARALAADAPIMLFDEPFGALDPVLRFELQHQFLELRSSIQKTTVFVTHDVREALRLGDRVALLVNGRLELIAKPGEFIESRMAEAQAFLACLD